MVNLNHVCYFHCRPGSPTPVHVIRRHRSRRVPMRSPHPRTDTLGTLGRFGRGDRPLIFSTELARSAPGQIKHPSELRRGLTAAQLQEKESEFAENLVQDLGRSVAVYGMICLRTDGHKALFAQKLEKPASNARKWDLHLLGPDENGRLTYRMGDEGR